MNNRMLFDETRLANSFEECLQKRLFSLKTIKSVQGKSTMKHVVHKSLNFDSMPFYRKATNININSTDKTGGRETAIWTKRQKYRWKRKE